MAEKDRYIDLDMNGNRVLNLPTPSVDGEASTKKYVDDEIAANAGGGGAVVEWQQIVIPTNANLNEGDTIVSLGTLPQSYYRMDFHIRMIGPLISATKTDVTFLDIVNSSNGLSIIANEKMATTPIQGAENQGNRYFSLFFNVGSASGFPVEMRGIFADPAKTTIIGGGRIYLYRLADPVTSWTP